MDKKLVVYFSHKGESYSKEKIVDLEKGNTKYQKIMKEYGTQLESWGPFAEGKNNLFTNETLVEIGKKYNKTAAQVALRYLIQRDVGVIPKTVKKERMIQL